MCCRCGDLLCPTRPWKVCDVRDECWRLEVLLYALEMLEGMRRVLRCMLEAVEDEICVAGGAGVAGGDAPPAALYAGGCGGELCFAGSAGVAGGDARCAVLCRRPWK